MFEKHYAEIVPTAQLRRPNERFWHLPHHPVFNPKKPDKTRVVFDRAATYQGVSLNSQILQGPDLANNLIGVLTRFRQEPIALIADIEAMFHQVLVHPNDLDALRFLWFRGNNLNNEVVECNASAPFRRSVVAKLC